MLPLLPRARVAMGVLGLLLVANVVALVVDFEFLSISDRIVGGERVPFSDVVAADDHLSTTGIAQLVFNLLAIVAFILWYSRAYRNVIAMEIGGPRYGPRWAVGSWFVPFVNLVIPKNVTNDIYRGTDPQAPFGDPGFAHRPVSSLLHWWWAGWLLTGLLNRIASSAYLDAATPQELSSAAKLYIAADLVNVIAAGLAIMVVRTITDRSELRLMKGGPPDASDPVQAPDEPASDPPQPEATPPAPWTPPPPPLAPRDPGEPPPADKSGSFGPPGYKG